GPQREADPDGPGAHLARRAPGPPLGPSLDLCAGLLHRLRSEDAARRARGDRAEPVGRGHPADRAAGGRTRRRGKGDRCGGGGAGAAGRRTLMIRRVTPPVAGALLAVASTLFAHDLFIKLDTFFLTPGAAVRVPVLNGTFIKTENAIERRRTADLSLVAPGGRMALDTAAVSAQGDTTILALRLRGRGTYVLGLSTKPSEIALGGKQFTEYLREEAIRDVLDARARAGISADSAHEQYSKHVKAVFQVGAGRTDGFATPLGYQAEIVPLDNPYALGPDRVLRVRCLLAGK